MHRRPNILADGLLEGMGEAQLRELAEDGGIATQPNLTQDELRAAIRADNAARARAAGLPTDGLPTLTAQQAHDLARQLTGHQPTRSD